jgi:hypothetical protein
MVAAFAAFEFAVAGLAPVADALDHARAPATRTDGSRQPSNPEHDPFSCATCQHVERSRSAVAHPPELVLTSLDNPLAPSIDVATPLSSTRAGRPHSRDPPSI